jgi:hypothetical protein
MAAVGWKGKNGLSELTEKAQAVFGEKKQLPNQQCVGT